MAPTAIKIGVIGYGNASRVFHLPYIARNPRYDIYAFFQRDAKPVEGKPHCSIDFPKAKHYTDVNDFLKDKDIELVCVYTRDDMHYEFSKKALEAGKDVISEKPVAQHSEQVTELIELSKKVGKGYYPFQNRRYDSDAQTLAGVLQKGWLGDITEAEIHYDLDLVWAAGIPVNDNAKPGEGLNFGIGCHTLDNTLTYFGTPKSVTAFYRTLRKGVDEPTASSPTGVEDSFTIVLQYADKPLIVYVKHHVQTRLPYVLKHMVRGMKGTYIKYGEDQQENQTHQGMKPGDEGFGVEPKECEGELTTTDKVLDSQVQKGKYWVGKVPIVQGDYGRYYDDVAKAIRGEIEQVVKGETSRDGIRIIELSRQSAIEGRTIPFSSK